MIWRKNNHSYLREFRHCTEMTMNFYIRVLQKHNKLACTFSVLSDNALENNLPQNCEIPSMQITFGRKSFRQTVAAFFRIPSKQ